MTLEDYRKLIGWSIAEFARQAGIDYNTLKKALKGEPISTKTAKAITTTLTRAMGKPVLAGQIEGLNVIY